MGKALVISGVDFSSANIGQVTPSQEVPLISFSLSKGTVNRNNIAIDVEYFPENTTQRSLEWSIISGSQYATINNGELAVLEGANENEVTIQAVSTYDGSISDTITFDVTYDDSPEEYSGLVFDGASAIDTGIAVDGSHKIEINLTVNSQFTSSSIQYRVVLGGRTTNSSNRRDIQYCNTATGSSTKATYPKEFIFGSGTASTNIVVDKQNGSVITLVSSPSSISVDNTSKNVSIPQFSIGQTYYLGCQNQGTGIGDTYLIYDTIHYVKIWDSNDALIGNFVPALYNGDAGLLNKADGTFHGNEKSGTLTVI